MSATPSSGQGTVKFYRTKEGKFYASDDKEFTKPFDDVRGILTDIRYKDEENYGVKVNFSFKGDDGETSVISVLDDSKHLVSLVGFLLSADLREEVIVVPTKTDKVSAKGTPITDYLVKQVVNGSDVWMSSFFKKGSGNELPQWQEKKKKGKPGVDSKTEYDRTEYYEKVAEHIEKMKNTLPGINNLPKKEEKPQNSSKEQPTTDNSPEEVDDDLPF